MNSFIKNARAAFNRDFTETTLRASIIVAALIFIVLALTVKNKWLLAGILAYEVLP